MNWLLFSKVVLYFFIAALTVFVGGLDVSLTGMQWTKLIASSVLAGLVAVRAFFDRSLATAIGTPVEPSKEAPRP